MTAEETQTYKITRAKTLIEVAPRRNLKITFEYERPRIGNHTQLAEDISVAGLMLPSQGDNVALAYTAFMHPEEPEFSLVKDIMARHWFWSYTDIHDFPGSFKFFHDFFSLDRRLVNPSKNQLEAMLGIRQVGNVFFSDDGSLRMVQGRYAVGELPKGKLSKHPYVTGFTGSEELADLADELAVMHSFNPRLGLCQDVSQPEARVSTLESDRSVAGAWLYMSGKNENDLGGCRSLGYAFGVKRRSQSSEK